MDNKIANSSTALLTDALTLTGYPFANTLPSVIEGGLSGILQSRIDTARDIVINEMKRCERTAYDVAEKDEFVSITFRYSRAAMEGTARLNLKLLAMVISGQAIENSVSSTEFNEFAETLSTLRRTELVYLGTRVRFTVAEFDRLVKQIAKDARRKKKLDATDYYPEIKKSGGQTRELPLADSALLEAISRYLDERMSLKCSHSAKAYGRHSCIYQDPIDQCHQ